MALRRAKQLLAIAELSRRLGNSVVDITTRQQMELRGFTLDTVPENLGEAPRRGPAHAADGHRQRSQHQRLRPRGLTPNELFDASPVVHELDRIIVGSKGNPEFTNLPRKFNITVTGCTDNCTHSESQDIALVPAKKAGRLGLQRAGRRQDGLRRIHRRFAAECFCRTVSKRPLSSWN